MRASEQKRATGCDAVKSKPSHQSPAEGVTTHSTSNFGLQKMGATPAKCYEVLTDFPSTSCVQSAVCNWYSLSSEKAGW